MGNDARYSYPLRRREVTASLLDGRGGLLVVTGLGQPTWDAAAAGDHELTFPLWAGMGGAVMTGLGLALAQPRRRVLVITGDGEMLMGVGSLITVGKTRAHNLAIAVLDNESYGETGMQQSHTADTADLAAIAQGAGIALSETVTEKTGAAGAIGRLRGDVGPVFADFKVRAETLALVMPPKEGPALKERFRRALADSE